MAAGVEGLRGGPDLDGLSASLIGQFNGSIVRPNKPPPPDYTTAGQNFNDFKTSVYPAMENICQQFDAGHGARTLAIPNYEGGGGWTPGKDVNNGINSVNAVDITAPAWIDWLLI